MKKPLATTSHFWTPATRPAEKCHKMKITPHYLRQKRDYITNNFRPQMVHNFNNCNVICQFVGIQEQFLCCQLHHQTGTEVLEWHHTVENLQQNIIVVQWTQCTAAFNVHTHMHYYDGCNVIISSYCLTCLSLYNPWYMLRQFCSLHL